MEKFDARGREIPDTTPVEIPANARRPESMQDQMARMIKVHLNDVAHANEMPTFEEEDDFDDPTEALVEPGADYYITDSVMQPIGPENDLDGSEGLQKINVVEEAPKEVTPRTAAQVAKNEGPAAEAPKE